MEERRGLERLSLKANINLRTKDAQAFPLKASLRDLGFGGMGLYSRTLLPVDEPLDFDLSTGLLEEPLAGKGTIRHVNRISAFNPSYVYGIQFTSISDRPVKKLIDRALREQRRKPNFFTRHKSGLFITLPFSLIFACVSCMLLVAFNAMEDSFRKEDEYWQKYRDAVIYYLYNNPPKNVPGS